MHSHQQCIRVLIAPHPCQHFSSLVYFFVPVLAILLSADEWIRKLWYIYTMEYYSAIKKNTFESVLMSWMKPEPIIQSEVSQKEKHQYSKYAAAAAKLLQLYPTLCNTTGGSPPGSLSLGFSRQEDWSGLPFPSPMRESEK